MYCILFPKGREKKGLAYNFCTLNDQIAQKSRRNFFEEDRKSGTAFLVATCRPLFPHLLLTLLLLDHSRSPPPPLGATKNVSNNR
jgi:hypothetical protein